MSDNGEEPTTPAPTSGSPKGINVGAKEFIPGGGTNAGAKEFVPRVTAKPWVPPSYAAPAAPVAAVDVSGSADGDNTAVGADGSVSGGDRTPPIAGAAAARQQQSPPLNFASPSFAPPSMNTHLSPEAAVLGGGGGGGGSSELDQPYSSSSYYYTSQEQQQQPDYYDGYYYGQQQQQAPPVAAAEGNAGDDDDGDNYDDDYDYDNDGGAEADEEQDEEGAFEEGEEVAEDDEEGHHEEDEEGDDDGDGDRKKRRGGRKQNTQQQKQKQKRQQEPRLEGAYLLLEDGQYAWFDRETAAAYGIADLDAYVAQQQQAQAEAELQQYEWMMQQQLANMPPAVAALQQQTLEVMEKRRQAKERSRQYKDELKAKRAEQKAEWKKKQQERYTVIGSAVDLSVGLPEIKLGWDAHHAALAKNAEEHKKRMEEEKKKVKQEKKQGQPKVNHQQQQQPQARKSATAATSGVDQDKFPSLAALDDDSSGGAEAQETVAHSGSPQPESPAQQPPQGAWANKKAAVFGAPAPPSVTVGKKTAFGSDGTSASSFGAPSPPAASSSTSTTAGPGVKQQQQQQQQQRPPSKSASIEEKNQYYLQLRIKERQEATLLVLQPLATALLSNSTNAIMAGLRRRAKQMFPSSSTTSHNQLLYLRVDQRPSSSSSFDPREAPMQFVLTPCFSSASASSYASSLSTSSSSSLPSTAVFPPSHFHHLPVQAVSEFNHDLAVVLKTIPDCTSIAINFGAQWKTAAVPHMFLTSKNYPSALSNVLLEGGKCGSAEVVIPNLKPEKVHPGDVIKDISKLVFAATESASGREDESLSSMSFHDALLRSTRRANPLMPLFELLASELLAPLGNYQIQIRDIFETPSTYLLKTTEAELTLCGAAMLSTTSEQQQYSSSSSSSGLIVADNNTSKKKKSPLTIVLGGDAQLWQELPLCVNTVQTEKSRLMSEVASTSNSNDNKISIIKEPVSSSTSSSSAAVVVSTSSKTTSQEEKEEEAAKSKKTSSTTTATTAARAAEQPNVESRPSSVSSSSSAVKQQDAKKNEESPTASTPPAVSAPPPTQQSPQTTTSSVDEQTKNVEKGTRSSSIAAAVVTPQQTNAVKNAVKPTADDGTTSTTAPTKKAKEPAEAQQISLSSSSGSSNINTILWGVSAGLIAAGCVLAWKAMQMKKDNK